MTDLTREEIHSLNRLGTWPRLDVIPDEHIEKFIEMGLVKQILGGPVTSPTTKAT